MNLTLTRGPRALIGATQSETGGYRLDVQGLRGISVLLVVLFHAGLGVPGGFIGVDVFFVISGFVIGRGLINEAERNEQINVGQFYARRVRRLLPALAAMVATAAIASVVILAPAFPQPNALRTAMAATFSSSNIFLFAEGGGYFTPLEQSNPFVHTWSLGVEEQFYLLFPLMVFSSWWLASRIRGLRTGRRLFTVLVLGLATTSLVFSIVLTYGVTPLADIIPEADRFAFYGPITRIWEFLAGVVVALWTRRFVSKRASAPKWRAAASAIGLSVIVASALMLSARTPFPGVAAGLPVGGAVLVLAFGSGVVATILKSPGLVWIGDRSYSWYLWHWPAIVLCPLLFPTVPGIVPLAALGSLVPAMLSYRFLEQRFRARRGSRPSISAPRLAAVSLAVPAVVLAVGIYGANRNWGLDQHPELSATSISQESKCFEFSTPIQECTFGPSTGRGTLMLVGDSHADTISDPVIDAATAEGYDVVVQTYVSCPFVSGLAFDADCVARQANTMELIGEIEPEVLVIANNSRLALSKLAESPDTVDVYQPPSSDVLASWEAALTTTFGEVEPFVDRVVLFSVVPYFRGADFDVALPSLLRPTGTFPSVTVQTLQGSRSPILEAEGHAVELFPELVTTIDPLPMLCDAVCDIRSSDGTFRYRDTTHLTNPTARTLTAPILAALRSPSD